MKKKFLYIAAVSLVLGASGCDKFGEFGDTNVNPDAINTPVPASLLAGGLNSARGYAYQITPGYYAQYFSETQYPSASVYADARAGFAGTYSGALYDFQNIQTLSTSTNNQKQVATIAQQYIIWNLTDVLGDMPYSEAMKGVDFTSPKYDTQEEIYKGMLAKLTAAAAAFDNSQIIGDIMYNGSAAKWRKLNNSLRMLMSLQLSKKYPGASDYAATQFKAALADAGGSIEVNADNWQVTPPDNYNNPYWSQYDGRRDNAVSDTYVNMMLSLNDDRLKAHAGNAANPNSNQTSTKGVPYGRDRAFVTNWTDLNPDWAYIIRGDLREQRDVHFLLTAGQILLARAEAAQLGWTTESATSLYARGIEQSFLQWGRTSAEATAYVAQASVALGTDNVRKIATQRYFAHFPDGLRAWNIWRKTGFPVLTPAQDYLSATRVIPQRYMYETAESTSNPAGLKGAVDRFPDKKDSQLHKVWWAQ
ncbi:SusD/RagB family nutrient-binding outer membrane lipoprotein [Pedobacter flavus]|uniref:SusD/RagB family nutrient-binding outer membrane lipoprotein n=1 Tax=Pedobacter flavus TaxID=3113906 RepID=A0ABU7GZF5_9SPHI|nr:SusD/RagB family nutrient-binding outer membrane lipoprotein [Pedobacter sp. VNH31]MEE1884388.1 SusD/RagB family nutrient-binding outer membrane lipoprotein [Pedobacter sp. VNH31]